MAMKRFVSASFDFTAVSHTVASTNRARELDRNRSAVDLGGMKVSPIDAGLLDARF
jgi:hypothetical protein